MEDSSSILDKIISTKQVSDMEQFNPAEAISILLKELTGKEEDILRRRYALSGKDSQTLEEIGKIYQVTRERIRQIENTAIKKLRKSKIFDSTVQSIEHLINDILNSRGGVMEERSLLDNLLGYSGPSETNRQAVLFFLSELLKEKVEFLPANEYFKEAWKLKSASVELIKQTVKELYKIVEEISQPVDLEELVEKFWQSSFAQENNQRLNEEVLVAALDLSQHISKNPFDEYGLVSWGSIAPKRMNDKIILILKKNGKPLHFTEIAKKINEANFDKRKAYPPTVHNELILNKEYVLVGRGIYALREWGYREGVVSEVIVEILKKSEKPLKRDELVDKVLEQRIVKKNTIHLALTNRKIFKKHTNGEYSLVDNQETIAPSA